MKGSKGDAARVWHILDEVLPVLRDACSGLEDAECDALSEVFGEAAKEATVVYEEVEGEVAEDIGGGPGRST